jgi:coenzyme F420-reducing hydrogenase delta subunit
MNPVNSQKTSDIIIYICKNCIPQGGRLPVQWTEGGMHVRIKEIPCSGKIDAQYMLHALEGGVRGICIVTCPLGECTLSQGNYRSEIRAKTVQCLLSEIGLDPKSAAIVHCPPDLTAEQFKDLIHDMARSFTGVAATAQS